MLNRFFGCFVLAVSLHGLCIGQASQSQETISESDALSRAFEEWHSNGFVNGTIKATAAGRFKIDVAIGTGEIRTLATSNALMLRSSRNLAQKIEGNPIGVMNEIMRTVSQLCKDISGEIRYANTDFIKSNHDFLNLIKGLPSAQKALGGHTCVKDGKAIFHIDLMAPAGRASSSFTEGVFFDWLLMQVSAKQIEAAEEETRIFRSKLSAGSDVALHIEDVPPANRPKRSANDTSIPSLPGYRLCGILIDQKPGLAQVQVGGGVFFVKDTLVFPTRKIMDAKTGYHLGATGEWCWR